MAALVIGFENHTEYVWAGQKDALETLNGMVERGGEPLGIIAVRGNELRAGPLDEYREEEWVEKYLIGLLGEVRYLAEAAGHKVSSVRNVSHEHDL